jgi:uncharacterized protein DUF4388
VSFGGRLETLDLSVLLQTLSVGAASGRLTLTRLDRHAVLVLRSGRVVYAAGGSAGETLAGRLLREGLVAEADLMTALDRQHDGTGFKRLGDVLVEMGLLAEGTLQAVVRRRMEELVSELLAWNGGFFRFEPASASDADIEVDHGDFVLAGGLASQELLMRAVAALDRGDLARLPSPDDTRPPLPAATPPHGKAPSATGSYPVDFTGEAVLSLLRFASQLLARAVVFSVEGDAAHGVGEFGVVLPGGRSGADAVRQTILTLREPSILRTAADTRRTYVGPLEPTRVNLALAERLGGAEVREAVAVPLLVAGEVRFLLYGDNAPSGRPIGPIDALESSASRAARIIEKTLQERAKEGGFRPA